MGIILVAPAVEIGMFPDDEVDALDILPVPEPSSILSLLALGIIGTASTLKRKLKPYKGKELGKV